MNHLSYICLIYSANISNYFGNINLFLFKAYKNLICLEYYFYV